MDIFSQYIKRIKEGLLKEILDNTIWIYAYVRRYWIAIIIYTLIGFTGIGISLISSMLSRDLVDIITGHQTGEVIKTFCLMIGFGIGNSFIIQITNYASSWISIRVDNEIKAEIYEKILVTDWMSITKYHTGDLLSRWNKDASTISTGVLSWLPNAFISLAKFITALSIVVINDPSFAVFALLGFPVTTLMSRSIMKRMVNNNKRSAQLSAKTQGFNQEAFSNIQTVKAFDLISLYTQRLKQLQTEYLDMKMEFSRMSMITSIIMATVGLIVSYSCYGWGIYRVWSGAITYGTMTLFLTMSSQLTSSLNALINLVPSAINMSTSITRLRDILNMPKEDFSDRPAAEHLMKECASTGLCLTLKDINFSYNASTKVFKSININAMPGEIIALVGPSGEGKTTLLRLLLSLLPIHNGSAYVNIPGSDKTLKLSAATRLLFSYVPQGNTMFSGTIAENLRSVAPQASDDDIIAVLKLACAWDFVDKLPAGIDSPVLEKGGGFSEGQAQRLAIARALLRQSPILLLDEATSALDAETERRILENILTSDYPRTVIVTTHRPTVLTMCSKVYRISNGQLNLVDFSE